MSRLPQESQSCPRCLLSVDCAHLLPAGSEVREPFPCSQAAVWPEEEHVGHLLLLLPGGRTKGHESEKVWEQCLFRSAVIHL